MTDSQRRKAGAALARDLGLKRDEEHPDRWVTQIGTKTDLGLWLFIEEEINEVRSFVQSNVYGAVMPSWPTDEISTESTK